jgi:putative transposase
MLLGMIAYKAEEAGRTVIAVDPRHTSQRCHACGHIEAGNRAGVVFRCLVCGHTDHADVNAARNILRAGLALREGQAA